ncbi:MAG: hypothetical protein ACE5EC_07930 [Phycisphaerae bacterium]
MKPRRKLWLFLAKHWAPLLAGGVALQFNLTGCDPEVRTSVLGGIQASLTGLLTSVINAFFLAIQGTSDTTTSQPVVQGIIDAATGLFA